jgi:flavin reductase (DIM6/NTAB) family NADH-FMN oxidoreductase RutF
MTDSEKKLFIDLAPLFQRELAKGIFLNVGGETPNTMTIGWGSVGIFWGRPVVSVPIRPQRFTYPILEKVKAFIISVPEEGALTNERLQAGTWSGRDGDKFARLGLATTKGKVVDAPAINACKWQIECVVKAAPALAEANTDAAIVSAMYPGRDFHTLFMGEVAACYETGK